jgi:hypothetical protein
VRSGYGVSFGAASRRTAGAGARRASTSCGGILRPLCATSLPCGAHQPRALTRKSRWKVFFRPGTDCDECARHASVVDQVRQDSTTRSTPDRTRQEHNPSKMHSAATLELSLWRSPYPQRTPSEIWTTHTCRKWLIYLASRAGFESATNRLTGAASYQMQSLPLVFLAGFPQ